MTHYQSIRANKRTSWIVVFGFIGFVFAVSYIMSQALGYGLDFVGGALILSGIMSFGSYWFSDKIILSISGARKATREEFFDFYTVTENLVMAQRMEMPDLYVIEDSAMNAFATGRNPEHAVVCATTGLLQRLDRSELEGVVAHELAHVQNYDIRLMSIVSILVGFVTLLADWFLRISLYGGNNRDNSSNHQMQALLLVAGFGLALLSPFIAQLMKLAISRRREYLADSSSAGMTKNPEGLIRALQKISQDKEPLEAANKATAHLYISNPLKGGKDARRMFAGLFQTHPPVEERIAALQKM